MSESFNLYFANVVKQQLSRINDKNVSLTFLCVYPALILSLRSVHNIWFVEILCLTSHTIDVDPDHCGV